MADLSCILVGAVMTCTPLTSNVPTTTIFMQDRTSVNESIGQAQPNPATGLILNDAFNKECRGKIDPLFVDFCRTMRNMK